MGGGQLCGSQLAMEAVRATRVAMPWLLGIAAASLATPTTVSGCKIVPRGLFFVIVPLFTTKMPKLLAYFFIQNDETLTVDPSQIEPYFEVTILNC